MNTRLLFALLWLTPLLCRGASFTSYFYNVEALTNVTARSTVRADSGAFTNGLTAGASTFTGPITHSSYTVATLPAAALYSGATVWCSDTLTPLGVGDMVYSDGSFWRGIGTKIKTTASNRDLFFNLLGAGYRGQTPAMVFNIWANSTPLTGLFGGDTPGWYTTSGGSVTASSQAGYGNIVWSTLASSTANVLLQSYRFTPQAGDYAFFGNSVQLSALSDDTDQYRVAFGIGNLSTSASLGNEMAMFIYDRHVGYGLAITATNNWNVFTTVLGGGPSTVVDTGVPADTSPHTFQIFMTCLTNVVFFVDGAPVATNTTDIPTGEMQMNSGVLKKGAGTTPVTLSTRLISSGIRYANPRSFQ